MDAMPFRIEEKPLDPHLVTLDSVALERILKEVRNDMVRAPTAYNRVHNRHNR